MVNTISPDKALHHKVYGWPGGDTPGKISYHHEVPPSLVLAVKKALKAVYSPFKDISEFHLLALHEFSTASGSYLLRTEIGSWFLRISTRIGNWQLEQAITEHLLSNEVSVNKIIASAKLNWKGKDYRTDLRPIILGRHFKEDQSDLFELASTLGSCHRTLKKFSRDQEILQNQNLIAKEHIKVQDLISDALTRNDFSVFHEREEWAKQNTKWLSEMNKLYNPNFHLDPKAQPVHGEIHPANVIFDLEDGSATLVDFETSIHTFAPPSWDLAYFVLRFVLKRNLSSSKILECKSLIETAYGEQLPPLSFMMRQTCWYCIMCGVNNRLLKEWITPVSEYNKFIQLEHQAKLAKDVL